MTERHASIQKLKFLKQNKASFMHKCKVVVSRGIWTILPQWSTEFCELAHGIWQNLPQKTVGPNDQHWLECPTVKWFCCLCICGQTVHYRCEFEPASSCS